MYIAHVQLYSDHPKLVTQMDNPCNPFLDLCMNDLVGNGKLIAIAIAGSNFGTLLWEEMAVLTHFICKMYLSYMRRSPEKSLECFYLLSTPHPSNNVKKVDPLCLFFAKERTNFGQVMPSAPCLVDRSQLCTVFHHPSNREIQCSYVLFHPHHIFKILLCT